MADTKQFEQLKLALEHKKSEITTELINKHSSSWEWLEKTLGLEKIKNEHLGRIAAAAATGMLLLNPGNSLVKAQVNQKIELVTKDDPSVAGLLSGFDKASSIAANLKELTGGDLTADKQKEIEQLMTDSYGLNAKFSLDGFHMNVSKGLIGAEQHLYRWPGDSLEAHLTTPADQAMFGPSGVAPNRGAWGYFGTPNSPEAIANERYYFAVETFLSPNWALDQKATYEFFKFRKMVAVNTQTGQAVVAVVGDAGPSQWTGKSYGGSPEVMHYLGLGSGPRKGEVIMMFVDDPNNSIPLGPITLKQLGSI